MLVDCIDHLCVVSAVAACGLGLADGAEKIDQLVDTVLCAVVSGTCDGVINTRGTRADCLGAVVLKTYDIGRVHSGRTGIYGIEVNVEVEENVLHGHGVTVGVNDVVLENEGVGGLVGSGVVVYDVVENYNRVILTVSNGNVTVNVVGAEHTNLGHSNDVSVCAGGGEEGVEKTVKVFGHDNERVGRRTRFVARCGRCEHTEEHNGCKHQ